MSTSITYKTLVAINLLHNYYLDGDASAYYSLAPAEKINALDKVLAEDRYLIMRHLRLEPTSATQDLIRGHKIICRKTDLGLIVAIPVQKETVNDQVLYKPAVPFRDTDRLQFKITIKDPSFLSYTNIRLNPVMPAAYYFTNNDIKSPKTFPSLSAPISSFVSKRVYEMGEAATVNNAPSQAVTRTSKATEGWAGFNDNNYVTENDRMLLPKEFVFVFDQEKITKAKFSLLKDNSPVKVIDLKDKDSITEVPLSFKKADDDTVLASGIYTLSISASNGYQRDYVVYLDDELYQSKTWGIIDLSIHSDSPNFSLVTPEGYLAAGTDTPRLRFEVRFLSRATYWKYYFQQKAPAGTDDTWNDLPPPAGMQKVVISKQPLSLMSTYRKVNYASIPLPNPSAGILGLESDKICSDVMLTKIKL